MKNNNETTIDTPTKAVEMLWKQKHFEQWQKHSTVMDELSKRKYNFPAGSLSKALQRAKFLTKRGAGKNYEYIQRYPSTDEK